MMGSVCGEQHKLHHLFLNNKALIRDVIDIPPRKLLHRRPTAAPVGEVFGDSPRADEEALLQKFLPCNNGGDDDGDGDDDDDDPYSSDYFRMYEFKVRRCTRSRSHDWTDCPFAHPGEKARRRDPRRYHYSGNICSEFRRGTCSRGDNCEFAHGVFECWLHPARYRTEACKDGKNCKRKVCFFAHSARQLRVLPPSSDSPPANSPSAGRKYSNSNHCCLFCHNVTASPTSTLLGMSHLSPPLSPSLSPPLSPVKGRSLSGLSPVSRYGESCGLTQFNPSPLSYKDVLTELMSSLDSMNLHEASPHGNKNLPWIDVSFSHGDDQNLFVLSPSTPSPSVSRNFFSEGDSSSRRFNNIDDKLNDNGASACPDLGWVNDLLT
ncbi:zinc finger CCCH domain-containing protein 2-like [Diospyros lotus]|uniref:zinc finger CCCH domain-containing protein 2-like n=1 Tax=Diospyros lotus TaxID=55363 RepID=UPI002256B826|nr:zinc finger CCCH domain-containing protein 2-like [Diospyros lotus]